MVIGQDAFGVKGKAVAANKRFPPVSHDTTLSYRYFITLYYLYYPTGEGRDKFEVRPEKEKDKLVEVEEQGSKKYGGYRKVLCRVGKFDMENVGRRYKNIKGDSCGKNPSSFYDQYLLFLATHLILGELSRCNHEEYIFHIILASIFSSPAVQPIRNKRNPKCRNIDRK